MAKSLWQQLRASVQPFVEGFDDAYSVGGEDLRQINQQAREFEGKQAEMPKGESLLATHKGIIFAKQLADRARKKEDGSGFQTSAGIEARERADMELSQNPAKAFGQGVGTFAADLTQDATRRFYWLMNALQATGEVFNEYGLSKVQPKLYGKSPVLVDGIPLKATQYKTAIDAGAAKELADGTVMPKRGYSIKGKGKDATYYKRNYEPGYVQSLAIPTGIAINTGLGLMTPFGGAEGYKAALPSEEDPTKTSNVLGEVALKYFMGRTGQMLPYDEFVKVRPDVSPDEYGRYKAFKYDKKEDWNPLDGDLTMAAGAIKWTDEGIHGPELQFLGRGLPATTGIVPYLTSLAGGFAGAAKYKRGGRIRPIEGGFGGGMAGLAAGQIVGSLLENERRRRNAAANELNNPQSIE